MAHIVNESKTKHYRYFISYLLDDLDIGAKFQPSALHIITLPWFALETDEGPFLNWFYDHFDRLQAFDAVVGERKLFGPKKDVPVSIMEPQRKFMQLHMLALSWFGKLGARWAEIDPYVGNDYVPHIAQRRGFVLDERALPPISCHPSVGRRADPAVSRQLPAKAQFHE